MPARVGVKPFRGMNEWCARGMRSLWRSGGNTGLSRALFHGAMIRRTLTAQQRERVAQTAAQKRVAIGLDPVAADDLDYEARRAEARAATAARKRKRRTTTTTVGASLAPPCTVYDIDIRERVGAYWVEVKLHWTHDVHTGEHWAWSAFLLWEDEIRVRMSEAEVGTHACQAEALAQLLDALAAWAAHYPQLA